MISPAFTWVEDIFCLHHDQIDDTHREFIKLLNACVFSSKQEFVQHFRELVDHTHKHFKQDEELMTENTYPSTAEHKGEHARVLGELSQFLKRVERGNSSMAKAYIKEKLPEWFALHTTTMDSALAAHIAKA